MHYSSQNRHDTDQLAYLIQDIENAFQEKQKVLAAFFDLSQAVDTMERGPDVIDLTNKGHL